ncbi:MAG TPA: hypothetical protein VN736_01200 [Candidatus Limnocylindrales bacterium]|nr:hypothetical protein [Candidatus Limnocylindrales bacterium]
MFAKGGGWNKEAYDCELCKAAGYYRQRNCRRYFPDQPCNSNYTWEPEFQTPKGSFFGVSPCECTDCPVSFITPASRHLIQVEVQNQVLKESTGASLYGPDLSKWPSKVVDAFTCIATTRNEYDHEHHVTEMDELR